jgi:hypothetical protein
MRLRLKTLSMNEVVAEHVLADRLHAIHAECAVEQDMARVASAARLQLAADWIVANRPELTFGVPPKFSMIAEWSEQTSLAEFEQSHRGNAIRLHEADFGEVWWLDPGERTSFGHTFAIRSKYSGFAIEYEVHFKP